MNEIERLVATEEIRNLKARYFRAIDQKDAALLRDVFTDDVVLDYRGATNDPATGSDAVSSVTGEVMQGRDYCVGMLMDALPGMVSVHHGATPEIEIASETSASAIWPMVDRLRFPPGGAYSEMVGYGHYHETYGVEDGKWRIRTLRLTRLRVDFTAA